MDLYLFSLSLGFGGLLLMTLLGLSHGHHGGGHGHGHHGHAHHGPAVAKFKAGHSHRHHDVRSGKDYTYLLALLSPRVLFGLLFGFGAAGTLARPFLVNWPLGLLVVAAAGAWLFEHHLVRPLWKFLLNFASKPARTLDDVVFHPGCAATDFDRSGHGLVAVDLDGQTRQILGTLCPEERTRGPRVRTGDRLFIRAVDGARNTCTVSRLSC